MDKPMPVLSIKPRVHIRGDSTTAPKDAQQNQPQTGHAATPAYRKPGLQPRNAPLSMRFYEQVLLVVCGKQNESLWICGVGMAAL